MAVEPNNWPSWLKDMWANWLEDIGYPHAGVGDLKDLKFSLGVGQDGRWIGFVNPGWYYSANLEQYNYIQAASIQASGSYGSSGMVTESVSFRPSWGPILVQGITDDASGNNDGPYREHHNSFYPAYTFTWTALSSAASTILTATVPSSSILVGLRNYTNLPLGAVAGTGLLTNNKVYYYDFDNNKIYYKPKDPTDLTPDVWGDLLYTYPLLRFREIVVSEIDASGNAVVRPSYRDIQDVVAFRGSNTTLVAGFHASGAITHSLSNTYKDDWVVLDYWIAKSYILSDHKTLKYFVGGTLSPAYADAFKVYYERSVPDVLPNIVVNTPTTGIFNVFNANPLFEFGYRTGYLFHGSPASGINSYWVPSNLHMYLDKSEVCHDWSEMLKVKILATADNDLPLPYYPVSVSVSGGSALIVSASGRTDGRGEIHILVKPHRTGFSSITVKASCGALTASAVATLAASSSLIDLRKWSDGFVHVVVTNDRTGRGSFRAFAAASSADGVPRNHQTFFTSKLASEFHSGDSRTLTQKITVVGSISVPNIQGLSEFGYVPQPNDLLFGYSNTAISKLIRGEG